MNPRRVAPGAGSAPERNAPSGSGDDTGWPGVVDDLEDPYDPMMHHLRTIIRASVRALAILMTAVILWGVADVAWVLYEKLVEPPFLMLTISDILATFGAFMAVLIAIEIFVNINLYLRHDTIHVKIVMATALMAIARKVIILDFEQLGPAYIFATAAVVAAMSIGYWLVVGWGAGILRHPPAGPPRSAEPAEPFEPAERAQPVHTPDAAQPAAAPLTSAAADTSRSQP